MLPECFCAANLDSIPNKKEDLGIFLFCSCYRHAAAFILPPLVYQRLYREDKFLFSICGVGNQTS